MSAHLEEPDVAKLLEEMGFRMTHLEPRHLDWLGVQTLIHGLGTAKATPADIADIFGLPIHNVLSLVDQGARHTPGETAKSNLRARFDKQVGYELTDDEWAGASLDCKKRLLTRIRLLQRIRIRH